MGEQIPFVALPRYQESCDLVITSAQLQRYLDNQKDIIIIDVRDVWEREMGYIPGSIHVPLTDMANAELPQNKNALIIVYCQTGKRSQLALKLLTQQGFMNVYSLEKVIADWNKQRIESLA